MLASRMLLPSFTVSSAGAFPSTRSAIALKAATLPVMASSIIASTTRRSFVGPPSAASFSAAMSCCLMIRGFERSALRCSLEPGWKGILRECYLIDFSAATGAIRGSADLSVCRAMARAFATAAQYLSHADR